MIMWELQPLYLEVKVIFFSCNFRFYRMSYRFYSLPLHQLIHPPTHFNTHTQPCPINIWTIKDPTLKGVGHRRSWGPPHTAEGNLECQGYCNYKRLTSHNPFPPSLLLLPNLEHRQRQAWSNWKLLVSSVPTPISWTDILVFKRIKSLSDQLTNWHKGKWGVLRRTNCVWIRVHVCRDEKGLLLIKGG